MDKNLQYVWSGITKEAFNKVYIQQAIWKRSNEPKDYSFDDEVYIIIIY